MTCETTTMHNMKRILLQIIAAAATLHAAAQTETPTYLNPGATVEERVQDALSRMTLHEKVQILHAQSKFSSAGVPRLVHWIPDVLIWWHTRIS